VPTCGDVVALIGFCGVAPLQGWDKIASLLQPTYETLFSVLNWLVPVSFELE
jgi:hypothetical protein